MGIISKVVSTVRKIDGIYTMMDDAVKKIDEVYIFVEGKRHLVFPESTLIFEKTTAGEYEFTVPEKYNYIMVEIAGAAGGRSWYSSGAGKGINAYGGDGSILKLNNLKLTNDTITGVVGATPEMSYATEYIGGQGYSNGESSNKVNVTVDYICGGGGGGSSSVVVNSIVYEASAGGGGAATTMLAPATYGGKGGGKYGGARQNTNDAKGNDATDPNQIGLNSGNGYVRIYGIAG